MTMHYQFLPTDTCSEAALYNGVNPVMCHLLLCAGSPAAPARAWPTKPLQGQQAAAVGALLLLLMLSIAQEGHAVH